jgi:hypothetical protein
MFHFNLLKGEDSLDTYLTDENIRERIDIIVNRDEVCQSLIQESRKNAKVFFETLTDEQKKNYLKLESSLFTAISQCLYTVATKK